MVSLWYLQNPQQCSNAVATEHKLILKNHMSVQLTFNTFISNTAFNKSSIVLYNEIYLDAKIPHGPGLSGCLSLIHWLSHSLTLLAGWSLESPQGGAILTHGAVIAPCTSMTLGSFTYFSYLLDLCLTQKSIKVHHLYGNPNPLHVPSKSSKPKLGGSQTFFE